MSPPQHPETPSLPSGFVSIQDILDGKCPERSKVSVVGIVTDFRVPIPTRKDDWKCQIRFFDSSVQDDEYSSLSINIFRPKDDMPTAKCGDVILIYSAKLQRYQMQDWSLLTGFDTKLYTYTAESIPKPPSEASSAIRPGRNPKANAHTPSQREHAYVSHMFHTTSKERVPEQEEFEIMKIQSANVKDKFRLLKDVADGNFCDVVALVVRAPYDEGDKISLWLSDLTENSSFFHFVFNGEGLVGGRDGDPFGYTSKFSKSTTPSNWTGPYGKRSMQVTCWEPHATAIRETKISVGSWVTLRNLQVKFGHNAANLEGFLREDRDAHGSGIRIWSLDIGDDPESIDPRLKEALRRKRDYERDKKEQLMDITGAAKAGQLRKAEISAEQEPNKRKSRNNRKRKRSNMIQAEEEREAKLLSQPDLTAAVKCEHQDKPASRVAEMLEPVLHPTTIDGQTVKLQLPFVNINYRANVRVVDFLPPNLEAFTFPKKPSEYDVLSDNDGTSSESDDEDMMTEFTAVRDWEWRFYLQLEDAVAQPNQPKRRIWVAVDNQAAQCLVSLDASNLRHDKEKLDSLRQTLWQLWGDLEEHKTREQAKRAKSIKAAAKGDQPPPDSDDEDAPAPKADSAAAAASAAQVSNRAFPCCIRQYGVRVRETDATKADAGKGRRWQQMYGLFGTRIMRDECIQGTA